MKTSILSTLIAAALAVSTMAQDAPCQIELGMTFAEVAATWGLPVNQSVWDKDGNILWHYSVPKENSETHRTFYTAMVVFDDNGRVKMSLMSGY